MRARQCSNDACGFPLVPGESVCLICGQPVPFESPEEAAAVPINEGFCASDVTRSRSVLHLSFKSRRPSRLTAE